MLVVFKPFELFKLNPLLGHKKHWGTALSRLPLEVSIKMPRFARKCPNISRLELLNYCWLGSRHVHNIIHKNIYNLYVGVYIYIYNIYIYIYYTYV